MKNSDNDAQSVIDVFMKRAVKVEGHYDIFENEDNELMFVIKHLDSPIDEKRGAGLYYDGGEHAILIKNKEVVLICDNINPGIRSSLGRQKSVLFAEQKDGEAMGEYYAEVKYMENAQAVADGLIRYYEKHEGHW